ADPTRFADAYVSLVWASTASWFPLVAGLGLMAPALVPAFFGARWDGAVPLLQVMALMCFTCPLVYHTDRALLGVGAGRAWRNLCLVRLALAAAGYSAATRFGTLGVGIAFAGVYLLMAPFHFQALRRYTGVRIPPLLRANTTVYAAGVVMAVPVFGIVAAGR